ncbi:unnamed protein product, partial [Choristocarpus tenellus]
MDIRPPAENMGASLPPVSAEAGPPSPTALFWSGGGAVADMSIFSPRQNGRSFVWRQRLFLVDAAGRCACTECSMVVPNGAGAAKGPNTTNLIGHYKKKHPRKLVEALKAEEENGTLKDNSAMKEKGKGKGVIKANGVDTFKDKDEAKRMKVIKQAAMAGLQRKGVFLKVKDSLLLEAIVEYIVLERRNLQIVESESFQKNLRVASGEPEFRPPDRKVVRATILERGQAASTKLKELLHGQRPALVAHFWISDSGIGFISLCANWIDRSTWELQRATMACETFTGSPTASRIKDKLANMMGVAGLTGLAITITTSDAHSGLKSAASELPNLEFIACSASKVERSVRDCIDAPRQRECISKFSMVAAYLHASKEAREALDERQKTAKGRSQKIPLSSKRHWRSKYNMLEALLQWKQEVQFTLARVNGLGGGAPDLHVSDDEWETAACMLKDLEPFADAVETLEGDPHITVSFLPAVCESLH